MSMDKFVEEAHKVNTKYSYRGWTLFRMAGLSAAGVAGGCYYYRENIYRFAGGEGAKIASQTIQDHELVNQVNTLTQSVTETLLNDQQTLQMAVEFIIRLLDEPETRKYSVEFLNNLCQDDETKLILTRLLTELLTDPESINQLKILLTNLLTDREIVASMTQLVNEYLNHPETIAIMERLVVDLFKKETIRKAAEEFLVEVFSRQSVIDQAAASGKQAIADITDDPEIHVKMGDLGWNSFVQALTPKFLKHEPTK